MSLQKTVQKTVQKQVCKIFCIAVLSISAIPTAQAQNTATQNLKNLENSETNIKKIDVDVNTTPQVRKIFVAPLQKSTTITDQEAALLEEAILVASQTYADAYEFIGASDVKRFIDLEVERISMGCEQDSCLAELAGAVGAGESIAGRIGQLGGLWVLSLSRLDTKTVRVLSRVQIKGKNLDEIQQQIPNALQILMQINDANIWKNSAVWIGTASCATSLAVGFVGGYFYWDSWQKFNEGVTARDSQDFVGMENARIAGENSLTTSFWWLGGSILAGAIGGTALFVATQMEDSATGVDHE